MQIQQIGDKSPITFDQKQEINQMISSILNLKSDLTIELIPATILQEESDEEKLKNDIVSVIKQDIKELSDDVSLLDIKMVPTENTKDNSDIEVVATIFVPHHIIISKQYKNVIKEHNQKEIDHKINFILKIVRFENI